VKPFYALLLPVLILACLSSCTQKQYYAPGLYQNDVQNMYKPHSKDSVKSRFYATGVLLSQSGAGGQGTSTSGLLNIYRAHTIPHFNFSYGAIGYLGSYDRNYVDLNNPANSVVVNKSFAGYGLNGSTSFYLSTRKVDFRIIGVDLVYTHEGGDFLSFRKAQVGKPNVFSAAQAGMFTYGIFTEITVRPNNNVNFGFKLFVNNVTGDISRQLNSINDPYNLGYISNGSSTYIGYTSYVGYKHFTLQNTISIGGSNNSLGNAIQLGLGYRF